MNRVEKIHSFQVMRLIAAFFVVCIHIPFNDKMGKIFIAYGKIAVPFFLVICGYFLYRDDTIEFLDRIKKQIKKMFIMTIAANLGYMFYVLAFYIFGGKLDSFLSDNYNIKYVVEFLLWNMSPFTAHLWYLGSLLYALVAIYILCKHSIIKYAMYFSPILLGIYIYLSRTQSSQYYYVYRNAILCTLAYVMMGLLIRRFQAYLLKVNTVVYFIITIILCFLIYFEFILYRGDVSIPYFSAELLIYSVVLFLLKMPDLGKNSIFEYMGEKYTLFIYIVHMAVIYIYNALPYSYTIHIRSFSPVIIFIVTLILAIVYYKAISMIKSFTH